MYDLIEELIKCESYSERTDCITCEHYSLCVSTFHSVLHSVYYTYTSNDLRNYLLTIYYAEGEI